MSKELITRPMEQSFGHKDSAITFKILNIDQKCKKIQKSKILKILIFLVRTSI